MKNLVPVERIETMIYLIRGQKVILDRDLAVLYGVSTGRLNEQVKRNSSRFPRDFMFSLTKEEISNISQFAISSKIKYSKNVNVFTEQGIAMLSGVLHSKRAVQMNIAIMRTFVKLRQLLSSHKELAQKLNALEKKIQGHDIEIYSLFKAIKKLMAEPKKPKNKIGFLRD